MAAGDTLYYREERTIQPPCTGEGPTSMIMQALYNNRNPSSQYFIQKIVIQKNIQNNSYVEIVQFDRKHKKTLIDW